MQYYPVGMLDTSFAVRTFENNCLAMVARLSLLFALAMQAMVGSSTWWRVDAYE